MNSTNISFFVLCLLLLSSPDAVEHLKELTSCESAWNPAYDGMVDVDESKVPKCTEQLMMLIKGITGKVGTLWVVCVLRM